MTNPFRVFNGKWLLRVCSSSFYRKFLFKSRNDSLEQSFVTGLTHHCHRNFCWGYQKHLPHFQSKKWRVYYYLTSNCSTQFIAFWERNINQHNRFYRSIVIRSYFFLFCTFRKRIKNKFVCWIYGWCYSSRNILLIFVCLLVSYDSFVHTPFACVCKALASIFFYVIFSIKNFERHKKKNRLRKRRSTKLTTHKDVLRKNAEKSRPVNWISITTI